MATEKHKAQSSIELISYTGMFLLAATATLAYVYPDWETNNRVATAETTMKDIKITIDNVYAAGPGRKETITIRVPRGVTKTTAQDGRIDMTLDMPGGGATDDVEVTDAPIRGYIPSAEGMHQLPIEYMLSGIVVIGSGLSIAPPAIQLNMTADNETHFTAIVSNDGENDMDSINVSAVGSFPGRIEPNETGFDLGNRTSKTLSVKVTTPGNIIPAIYQTRIIAQSQGGYAEGQVNINVGGIACGDTVKDGLEECDTRTPFTFPDRNNPFCPNPEGTGGGVNCSASTHQYQTYDAYGDCAADCTCQTDSPTWITCGTDCNDANYCNNCAHCFDSVKNCGETLVDGGGACPICDGVDDIAEGLACSLGDTQPCGASDCTGTKSCIANGTKCQWTECSTYSTKCATTKCCSCGGSADSPAPAYNPTYNGDCSPSADQNTCGTPATCSGGLYRGECTGLNTCTPDWDQSTWNTTSNISICSGQSCGATDHTCAKPTYPCQGTKTTYTCAPTGACVSSTSSDSSGCANLSACQAPSTIILHKLDGSEIQDYVDAPASWPFSPGFQGTPWQNCQASYFPYLTFTTMYITTPGAYAPYQDGTLKFYGKAWHEYNTFYQDQCHWTTCSGAGKGSFLRIGTDSNNYLEYNAPTPTPNWQQFSVNLKNPSIKVGTVDWNNIRYLDFSYIVGLECQPSDTGCGSCHGWLDYATLTK